MYANFELSSILNVSCPSNDAAAPNYIYHVIQLQTRKVPICIWIEVCIVQDPSPQTLDQKITQDLGQALGRQSYGVGFAANSPTGTSL